MVAALAMCVLAVVTAGLWQGNRGLASVPATPAGSVPAASGATQRSPAPTASTTSPRRSAAVPRTAKRPATPQRAKPVNVAARGPGSFTTAHLTAAASTRQGRLLRYAVRVEQGLPFAADATARAVHRTLSDRRSWTGSDDWRFRLVASPADADFTIFLVTPGTTDRMCAPLLTRGEVSCQNGNRLVLNAKRWAFGAGSYGDDVAAYRIYLVNHEVGHRLGHQHVGCPGQDRRAPVMMQQTKGLGGCRTNPWPAPARGRA